MFRYGFGPAGLCTINDPVARGYNTFADIHLVFTMFLVDKKDKPIGGFIYPVLDRVGKAALLDDVKAVLGKKVAGTTFEQYLRAYRNRLATHGDLSTLSLPDPVRRAVGSKPNARVLKLLDELGHAVDDFMTALRRELSAPSPRDMHGAA